MAGDRRRGPAGADHRPRLGPGLQAGTTGNLEVERTGQDRRLTWLLIEALLVLTAVATMARPTRVAPPVAPTSATIDDTTSGDLRLAGLARGGVAR